MQIRGGRGLGRGGGCALSGSGIWEKFTLAEGAGTPWAGGQHGAQLGEWKTVGPGEKSKVGHKATETSQPHFLGTQPHRIRVSLQGLQQPRSASPRHTVAHNHPPTPQHTWEHIGRHAHRLPGSASPSSQPTIAHTLMKPWLTVAGALTYTLADAQCVQMAPPCLPSRNPHGCRTTLATQWPMQTCGQVHSPHLCSLTSPCPFPLKGPGDKCVWCL